jgi:hypothetical protein
MQNKGLIKFSQFYLHWYFQLSFTFVASKVKAMQNLLLMDADKEVKYLDSIGGKRLILVLLILLLMR